MTVLEKTNEKLQIHQERLQSAAAAIEERDAALAKTVEERDATDG